MKLNWQNLNNWLLCFIAFSLPWQTRLILKAGQLQQIYWEYATISLHGLDILIILSLIIFLIKYKSSFNLKNLKSSTLSNHLNKFIFLLIIIASVSCFFNSNHQLAFYSLSRFLIAIGLFYAIKNSTINYNKIIISLIAGAVIAASLGLWQFSNQFSPANKWLGLAQHNPQELGISVIEGLAPDRVIERWLRAYGPLDHPNMLGGFLALSLVFLFTFFKKKQSFLITNLTYLSLILIYLGLLTSFSRAAWLAFIIGLIIFLISNYKSWKQFIIPVLILIFLSLAFYLRFDYLIITRFSNQARLETKSTSERVIYLNEAKQVIKQNWLLGVGLNNYSQTVVKNYSKKNIFDYQPVHNLFLLVWAEIGILGLLSLLFIFYFAFKANPAIASTLIILGLLDHWLWSFHFGIILFWVVLGIILKYKNHCLN